MQFPISGVEVSPLIPITVAFVLSFFTSMAGVSGAFLLLPFQMSFLGYTNPSVSATNQLFNSVAIPSGFITTMDQAAHCIAEMKQVAITYDYPETDLGIYLQPIENGRVAHLEFNMFYNPADA